ncbi:YeeE/YedE thiosulfate transporter family protein [Pseudomonas sp. NPDC090202]|uniref:YeeE/YedE thiosulfate transporter family protein n=1 Tax=unclassified Pseudomonas TaxID=196821 RepID=UPI0037F79C7A
MAVLILSTLLAFITGFAIRRGNICVVAAMHKWVVHRNEHHLRAFITGICCSGLVLLIIAWSLPAYPGVSAEYPVSVMTVLGGILFGVGAWLNQACVLGTIAFLTRGDLNYCATLLGMFAGALLGQQGFKPLPSSSPSPLQTPDGIALAVAAGYALVVVLELYRHFRARRQAGADGVVLQESHALLPMLIVVGISCGALHALNGEWTYLATLTRVAEGLTVGMEKPISALLIFTVATFLGGVICARLDREFALHRWSLKTSAQRMAGGATMGYAACMIPGGNESMMFNGIPSIGFHAITGYIALSLTLLVIIHFRHGASRRTER